MADAVSSVVGLNGGRVALRVGVEGLEAMRIRRSQQASEAVLLLMACLAPWAYGSEEAWAEFFLFLGIAALAILGVFAGAATDRWRALRTLPSIALAALAILAAAQAVPLSEAALRRLSPATAKLRASLVPKVAERVVEDPGPRVALPAATISQDPEASLQTAARLAAGWVLFQSVLALARGGGALRRFGIAIAGNATLLSLFSLIQMLTWNGKIYWMRESPSANGGPFVCHNHLAAYLNLGLGFALAFLLMPAEGESRHLEPRRGRGPSRGAGHGPGRGRRVWAAYATGMIFVGLIASLSRSGFLAMAASLLVAIIALRPRALRVGMALAGVLVLIPLFLFALGTTAAYQQRITSIFEKPDASSAVRLQIWQRAIRIWPAYPVLGTGLGSYPAASVRFFVNDSDEYYVHAENEYLEWLVEGGMVGFGLILLAVAGTARLAWRGLKGAESEGDRALILGALFGLLTLVIHSMGDFAFHMPAIAVVAVMTAAHLAKRALESTTDAAVASRGWRTWLGVAVAGAAALAIGVVVVIHGYRQMYAESMFAEAGILRHGRRVPLAADDKADLAQLERMHAAVARALRLRPDWAEGHLKLGMISLRLFELSAIEAFQAEGISDPAARATMSDPIYWFEAMHPLLEEKPLVLTELLEIEHFREYLVPAARSFLEARRCCPVLWQPHARLALLDYLLEGGDPPGVYLDRAVRLAGTNRQFLKYARGLALRVGDTDLLVRCWWRALRLDEEHWEEIADRADRLLTPEQILTRVVPSGQYAVLFAARLYDAPEDRADRDRFLHEAIRRLPHDDRPSRAERLALEATAWAQLGDQAHAEDRIEQALALEPGRAEWRRALVDWLIAWGRPREAHEQALVGLYFAPEHPETTAARQRAAEALTRDTQGPGPAMPR